jgi:hypothetical protein
MKRQYLYILFVLPLLLACKPKAPTHVVDAGTADFTKFIAIGDGHTAGYMDDGLSLDGQRNSFTSTHLFRLAKYSFIYLFLNFMKVII